MVISSIKEGKMLTRDTDYSQTKANIKTAELKLLLAIYSMGHKVGPPSNFDYKFKKEDVSFSFYMLH